MKYVNSLPDRSFSVVDFYLASFAGAMVCVILFSSMLPGIIMAPIQSLWHNGPCLPAATFPYLLRHSQAL